MEPAITTGCFTQELLKEALITGLKNGVRNFFLQAKQWCENGEKTDFPQMNHAGAKFMGFYEALMGSGYTLVGAENNRQHTINRLRTLCADTHRLGGRLIILGGIKARELEVRATTSEIHARLADLFDAVIPVFETRNIKLVVDVPVPPAEGKVHCLASTAEVLRFLEYYRHPLLRIAVRAASADTEVPGEVFFSDNILPYLAVVIFSDIQQSSQHASKIFSRLQQNSYRGVALVSVGEESGGDLDILARTLQQFKALIEV